MLSSKTVFHGRIFRVDVDRVHEPSGIVVQRDVVRHGGSVVILAVDDAGPEPLVLLERQYRYAAGQDLWEIPAGSIDPGEIAALRRQARIAGGDRISRPALVARPLLLSHSRLCGRDHDHLPRPRTRRPARRSPEDDEFITCKLMPLSRVVDMILSGRIQDGKTIAAALWLAETLRRRQSGS